MNRSKRVTWMLIAMVAAAIVAAILYDHFRPRPASQVPTITAASFPSEVAQWPTPVLIDFYADWCAPCRQMSPIVDQLAEQFRGQVKVVRVNVDEQPELARQFSITGIPTLVVVHKDQMMGQLVGLAPRAQVAAMLQKALTAPASKQ